MAQYVIRMATATGTWWWNNEQEISEYARWKPTQGEARIYERYPRNDIAVLRGSILSLWPCEIEVIEITK